MQDIRAHSTLNPFEAARYCGLAKATLAKLRCCGGSPRFLKLGRAVRYEKSALDEWLFSRRASSTSDADARLPRRLTDDVASAT